MSTNESELGLRADFIRSFIFRVVCIARRVG